MNKQRESQCLAFATCRYDLALAGFQVLGVLVIKGDL